MYRIIITCFIVGFCVSCTDNFLAEDPKDRLTIQNFYQNEDDAIAAIDACYNQLYGIYERLMFIGADLPTDVMKNGLGMPNQNLQNLEFMSYTSENTFISNIWSRNYSGINRVNNAINNISEMEESVIDEDLRNRLMGEARFLRALYYFNLVRFFGDVPLITKVESVADAMVPRSGQAEIYDFIIGDLEFAEQNLSRRYDENNMGRATVGAAKILLGKVHLTRENWDGAVNKLGEVIENEAEYGYGLHEDYGDNWRQSTETGIEAVFYVEFMHPPHNGNNAMQAQGPKYSVYDGAGLPCINSNNWESDIPTQELYNQFSDDDERKAETIQTEFICNGTVYPSDIPIFTKYWEEGQQIAGNSNANFHIIRYADALLMYSEALFEQGNEAQALSHINRVRERAFNDMDHNYNDLTREKIWKERLLELAQEGHRWFDLTRQNRFIERMTEHSKIEENLTGESTRVRIRDNIKEAMRLMPIPQHEIDTNQEMEQNPGY